ncbi:MAG: tetratricopeptide repeat protein, partial [Deltaproteobacteria bacterium]|nr:tetratricopeptide repeat protein [Deltaproteobacteria bacterium]
MGKRSFGCVREIAVAAALVIITLAVYAQTAGFEFVSYDDELYVVSNRHVASGLAAENISWAFRSNRASNWHPLTWLSHMLDCSLFGLDAGRHHLVGVVLHIVNALMLFAVLRLMTGALWRSGFTAALFALHPLHVESVAWVAERKDVLSTFFCFASLLAYACHVRRPRLTAYLLVVLFFVCGLLSKPMLVTLPFVLLLLDWWPLQRVRAAADVDAWRGLLCEKIPLFVLAGLSCLVTYFVQQGGGAVAHFELLPFSVRVANALVSYGAYMLKMVAPTGLAVLYPHPGEAQWLQACCCLALLAGLTVPVVRWGGKYRFLVTGWLWYLGTLVPVIGLVQVGVHSMADRYTYVPLVGLFIIIVWGAAEVAAGRRIAERVLAIAGVVGLCVLAVLSWVQTGYWKNSVVLYEHALAVTQNNYVVHNNLAVALSREGRAAEAIPHYREALRHRPDALTYLNLGILYEGQGQYPAAMNYYVEALKADPDYAEAHGNLGVVLALADRTQEAIGHYRRALQLNPDYAKVHFTLGLALAEENRLSEAIGHYLEAVRIEPAHAGAHCNLG